MKNNIKLPKIIFLVGPAASGKTTLGKIIKNEFPIYCFMTDLKELKKLAKLEARRKNHKRIVPFPSGDLDIKDPAIWDEILISCAKKLNPKKFYIFEFARGIDWKYLTTFKISKFTIYEHCFKLIFTTNPRFKANNTLIIHVKCDFLTRLNRNFLRKEKRDHFVAEEVMRNVYSKDVFHYISVGHNFGYFNNKIKIPVYSISNSKELPLKDRKKYFKIQIWKALALYNSNKGGGKQWGYSNQKNTLKY